MQEVIRSAPGVCGQAERLNPTRCGALARGSLLQGPTVSAVDARRPATSLEVSLANVQYQVRSARITDVERIVGMLDAVSDRPGADRVPAGSGDLLRQLVGLPNAVVLVAESGRRLAGAAVLALYPSVALGGFVGAVDVLVVDPTLPSAGVRDLLVDELLRSGRNKGCVAIETAPTGDPGERERWAESGFLEADRRMVRRLARIGAPPA
jgi:GNAT superfamily N-acetyltransferase